MILIDTSVWIDFFNGIEGKAVSILEKLIDREEDVFLSEFILTEVMRGFKTDKEYSLALGVLMKFPVVSLRDLNSWVEAVQIYRLCRKKGIIIRKTANCIIARTAIENDYFLLHQDIDFDRIATVCPLKVYLL
jgi:predicted nucleic acid-binding protein